MDGKEREGRRELPETVDETGCFFFSSQMTRFGVLDKGSVFLDPGLDNQRTTECIFVQWLNVLRGGFLWCVVQSVVWLLVDGHVVP